MLNLHENNPAVVSRPNLPRVRASVPLLGFHLFAALHFWYSCYYNWFIVKVPVRTCGLKFLTYSDAILQAIYFTVCFINDVLINNSQRLEDIKDELLHYVQKLQDTLFCCLAFPLSMFTGLTFWGVYLVNKNPAQVKAADASSPWWLNQFMHTCTHVLLELYLNQREYPPRKFGLAVLTITYLSCLNFIHYDTGMWGCRDRIIFFAGLLLFAIILYILGERLNTNFGAFQYYVSRLFPNREL